MVHFQTNDKLQQLYLLLFHIIVGILMAFTPSILFVVYYLVLAIALFYYIKTLDTIYFIYFLAYGLGFELIGRMCNLSPYVPWELTKYITPVFVFFILLVELFRKSNILLGLIIVLLSIPALILSESVFSDVVFSGMGIVNLGLMIMLFHNRIISLDKLWGLLRAVVLPLVSILFYITIETPSFDEISFALGANFDTTGGFGSNQISTVLGLGGLLLGMAILTRKVLFYRMWVDVSFMIYFLFRCLLSFSRGGMLVAIISFVVFYFYIQIRNKKLIVYYNLSVRNISLKYLIISLVVLISVFVVADNITNGLLSIRYQGDTGGTLRGDHEKTLNVITTGRWDIMVSDIEMWKDNMVWGVGAGTSSYLRVKYGVHQIVAHTEFSRMLAEHGIFGLAIILLILFYIPILLSNTRNRVEKAYLFSFLALGVLTSFHAGMRTFVTPFFVGLSTIRISN